MRVIFLFVPFDKISENCNRQTNNLGDSKCDGCGTYNGEAWQRKIEKEHGLKLEEVKKKEGIKGWQLLVRR